MAGVEAIPKIETWVHLLSAPGVELHAMKASARPNPIKGQEHVDRWELHEFRFAARVDEPGRYWVDFRFNDVSWMILPFLVNLAANPAGERYPPLATIEPLG